MVQLGKSRIVLKKFFVQLVQLGNSRIVLKKKIKKNVALCLVEHTLLLSMLDLLHSSLKKKGFATPE